jgi:hypothetical protein
LGLRIMVLRVDFSIFAAVTCLWTLVSGLLLPAKGPTSGLVPRDYTKVIIYDGALLFASAVSFGLVRVTAISSEILMTDI